jgi:hypothetical protein
MEFITHLDKIVKRKKDPLTETEARIQERLRKVEPGTPEFKELLENQRQCEELRKTRSDTAGWWQKLMDLMKVVVYGVGALVVTGFGYCLDQNSPKAMRIADRHNKITPNW